ncbi:MoaD/ThiS family protein [Desulfovibrio litoralis]|uniref:Sulfur carrier protein ThiS (Thiamine biosynthesis) n=1 Tax=Desulfovibrio litoralis DSM 11393 TaxID=1121455 RepID=A0A1M7THC3_9BACT|nr:MoaD/ThiS family protein [Desulfovibrio litoralis]SHN70152.1 Sulfur carrier protein ThiS (thiamine biosynthesis) [Desulfovibrio litoralis DSM 11393]
MKVILKFEANLKKYLPENSENYEIKDGSTVADLMREFNLEESQVMLAFVGEETANLTTPLKNKQSVTLCPFICGG